MRSRRRLALAASLPWLIAACPDAPPPAPGAPAPVAVAASGDPALKDAEDRLVVFWKAVGRDYDAFFEGLQTDGACEVVAADAVAHLDALCRTRTRELSRLVDGFRALGPTAVSRLRRAGLLDGTSPRLYADQAARRTTGHELDLVHRRCPDVKPAVDAAFARCGPLLETLRAAR